MKKVINGFDSLTGIGETSEEKERVDKKNNPTKKRTVKTTNKSTIKKKKVGRPKSMETQNEVRATFIVNNDVLTELKAVAKLEGMSFKAVAGEAFNRFLQDYKKKKGKIDKAILDKKTIL